MINVQGKYNFILICVIDCIIGEVIFLKYLLTICSSYDCLSDCLSPVLNYKSIFKNFLCVCVWSCTVNGLLRMKIIAVYLFCHDF